MAKPNNGRGPMDFRTGNEAAMGLEPAYAADCLAELGAILAQRGDERDARAKLDQALRLDPSHAAALRYRAALDGR